MAAKAQAIFKEGDIVKLKSGGPQMTVTVPEKFDYLNHPADSVFCQWFSGSKLSRGAFPPIVLMKVEDEKKG